MKLPSTKIQIGDLLINLKAHRLFLGENDMHLTHTEYTILALLAHHPDSILTHDKLLSEV